MPQTQQKTKKYTLLHLFSIVDGRLSTAGIESVYDILEHVCNMPGIMTHHLPTANRYVKLHPGVWYTKARDILAALTIQCPIKEKSQAQFQWLMDRPEMQQEIEVEQLPEELTSDETFGKYMVENSLLNSIGSKA